MLELHVCLVRRAGGMHRTVVGHRLRELGLFHSCLLVAFYMILSADYIACCPVLHCGGNPSSNGDRCVHMCAHACWGVWRECSTNLVSSLCCEGLKMRKSRESRIQALRYVQLLFRSPAVCDGVGPGG